MYTHIFCQWQLMDPVCHRCATTLFCEWQLMGSSVPPLCNAAADLLVRNKHVWRPEPAGPAIHRLPGGLISFRNTGTLLRVGPW